MTIQPPSTYNADSTASTDLIAGGSAIAPSTSSIAAADHPVTMSVAPAPASDANASNANESPTSGSDVGNAVVSSMTTSSSSSTDSSTAPATTLVHVTAVCGASPRFVHKLSRFANDAVRSRIELYPKVFNCPITHEMESAVDLRLSPHPIWASTGFFVLAGSNGLTYVATNGLSNPYESTHITPDDAKAPVSVGCGLELVAACHADDMERQMEDSWIVSILLATAMQIALFGPEACKKLNKVMILEMSGLRQLSKAYTDPQTGNFAVLIGLPLPSEMKSVADGFKIGGQTVRLVTVRLLSYAEWILCRQPNGDGIKYFSEELQKLNPSSDPAFVSPSPRNATPNKELVDMAGKVIEVTVTVGDDEGNSRTDKVDARRVYSDGQPPPKSDAINLARSIVDANMKDRAQKLSKTSPADNNQGGVVMANAAPITDIFNDMDYDTIVAALSGSTDTSSTTAKLNGTTTTTPLNATTTISTTSGASENGGTTGGMSQNGANRRVRLKVEVPELGKVVLPLRPITKRFETQAKDIMFGAMSDFDRYLRQMAQAPPNSSATDKTAVHLHNILATQGQLAGWQHVGEFIENPVLYVDNRNILKRSRNDTGDNDDDDHLPPKKSTGTTTAPSPLASFDSSSTASVTKTGTGTAPSSLASSGPTFKASTANATASSDSSATASVTRSGSTGASPIETVNALQGRGHDLVRHMFLRLEWLVDKQIKAGRQFNPQVAVQLIAADQKWITETAAFLKESETKVGDMLKRFPHRFASFRDLQKKGVQWPHSAQLRRDIEKAGFVFRPMMIKRDRCVCETCGVEVAGWRAWHNPWTFHNLSRHNEQFRKEAEQAIQAARIASANAIATAAVTADTAMPKTPSKPPATVHSSMQYLSMSSSPVRSLHSNDYAPGMQVTANIDSKDLEIQPTDAPDSKLPIQPHPNVALRSAPSPSEAFRLPCPPTSSSTFVFIADTLSTTQTLSHQVGTPPPGQNQL